MNNECEYCGSGRVVPVIDKRIERSPTAGNKYRQRCLGCWRWLPCCAADDWDSHDNPRILPADADPDNEDNLFTPDEYERQKADQERQDKQDERLAELKEQVGKPSAEDVAADGGEVQDVEDVEDDQDDQDVNEFDCPECGTHQTGFPDECDECGAAYRWPDEN